MAVASSKSDLREWELVGEGPGFDVYVVPPSYEKAHCPGKNYALVKMKTGFDREQISIIKHYRTRKEVEDEAKPARVTWKKEEKKE